MIWEEWKFSTTTSGRVFVEWDGAREKPKLCADKQVEAMQREELVPPYMVWERNRHKIKTKIHDIVVGYICDHMFCGLPQINGLIIQGVPLDINLMFQLR